MKNINFQDWLDDEVIKEVDMPSLGGQPDQGSFQAPSTGVGTGAGGYNDPSTTNIPQQGMDPEPDKEDISGDPAAPDMPEEQPETTNFESWKSLFFKQLIKGDANVMVDMIHQMRDRDLDSYQRKFVEDNLQIQFLRQDASVSGTSREIVKKIKEELDKNHPGTTIVNHIHLALEANPLLNNWFIKINGLWGAKQDIYRKFVASLINAAQVGGGGTENEDIVYNDNELSVAISTRFNSEFGNVVLGSWSLKEDDPERHLEAPELERLQEGSPEEKDVLMRRIVLESIVDKFKRRAFIIGSVAEDGTIYMLGIDLAELLKSSYQEGKLLVRTKTSENSDAMIDEDGSIIPYVDLDIKYAKASGAQNDDGRPHIEELDFLTKKHGQLFLTAQLQTIKDAATALQGLALKEVPYQGNPSDLQQIMRCVPSITEILTRRC